MGKNPSRFQEWSSASREDLISKSNKDGNATLEVQENLDPNLEKPREIIDRKLSCGDNFVARLPKVLRKD